MKRVEIGTVYEKIDAHNPRKLALVSQRLNTTEEYEDAVKIVRRALRNRESAFASQLTARGIQHEIFSAPELQERIGKVCDNGVFDMCVVAGEICSQSVSIAVRLRNAGFSGPIYLEMTEEEAIKKSSLDAIVANASRLGATDLLPRFVYLTSSKRSPSVVELETADSGPETRLDPDFPVDHWRPKVQPITATPLQVAPPANDIDAPPARIDVQITRVIRDTQTARNLKALYEYRCQICGFRIEAQPNRFYIEAHHVQPLGGGHNGLDTTSNMLVLCPNHHALFDFGAVKFISEDKLKIAGLDYSITLKHKLAPESIAYHNNVLSRCISN